MVKKKANIATRKIRILYKIFIVLLVLLVLLSTATYTWFAISKTPVVNNAEIYINSNSGLSLSWDLNDEDGWAQELNYSERFAENSILKPVTYSYENDCFYAANIGFDGRIEGIGIKLSDEKNTNRDTVNGYYIKATFYATAEGFVKVSLASPDLGNESYVVGTPAWDDEEVIHVNGGGGAQYAIRIGLRITPLNNKGEPDEKNARFVIYEPNAINYANYKGDYITEYVPTPSIDGEGKNLVPEENLIRQATTLWTEADPVQKDVVVYKYGTFLDDAELFALDNGETVKIELYLWLEGQDDDCTNRLGEAARIFSSIRLYATANNEGGMEEIK